MNVLETIARGQGQLWAVPDAYAQLISEVLRSNTSLLTADELFSRLGGERQSQVSRQQGGNVAVIPIRGTVMHRSDFWGGASTEGISAMLNSAMADASVGTIVLDIDSPGGTVTGVAELAQQIFESRGRGTKKIIAQVNSLAASAAYWLASQADEIVSMPSGESGSIGVVWIHVNAEGKYKNDGYEVTVLSAGKNKTEGSSLGPLSDEFRAVMQGRIDAVNQQFVADVARGRGVSAGVVNTNYGQGLVFRGAEALKAGLIDRIATMDATLSALVGSSRSMLTAEADEPALAATAKTEQADRLRRLSLV